MYIKIKYNENFTILQYYGLKKKEKIYFIIFFLCISLFSNSLKLYFIRIIICSKVFTQIPVMPVKRIIINLTYSDTNTQNDDLFIYSSFITNNKSNNIIY